MGRVDKKQVAGGQLRKEVQIQCFDGCPYERNLSCVFGIKQKRGWIRIDTGDVCFVEGVVRRGKANGGRNSTANLNNALWLILPHERIEEFGFNGSLSNRVICRAGFDKNIPTSELMSRFFVHGGLNECYLLIRVPPLHAAHRERLPSMVSDAQVADYWNLE